MRSRSDLATAARALADNDSGAFLSLVEALVITGPTGTNVADIVV